MTDTDGSRSLTKLMDLLVPLEETVSPDLRVYRWRPISIETPCLYNWIVPSNAEIPAVKVVKDLLQISVRIIVDPSDLDEQNEQIEKYWDLARDTIDADLVVPIDSVLSPVCVMARRARMRNIIDTFGQIEYLGLELIVELELHRRFA